MQTACKVFMQIGHKGTSSEVCPCQVWHLLSDEEAAGEAHLHRVFAL